MLGFKPLAAGPLASGPSGTEVQITAVLANTSSLLASPFRVIPSTTILNGQAFLIANALRVLTGSAILSGNSSLISNPDLHTAIQAISSTFPANAFLLASPFRQSAVTVTQSGQALLIANALQRFSSTARLSGNATFIPDLRMLSFFEAMRSRLAVSASLIANPNLLTHLLAISSKLSTNALLIANTVLVPKPIPPTVLVPGGSSYFTGPTAELLDYALDQPPPKRQTPRRKRITKPQLPPEASIPAEVPLPPKLWPQPIVIHSTPFRPAASKLETQAAPLGRSITHAQDESSDIEDAMMILKHLDLI